MEPRVWIDVTTLKRLRNYTPVGLTRVEANVVKAAVDRLPVEQTRFCSFNRYTAKMQAEPRDGAEQLLAGYGRNGITARDPHRKPAGLLRSFGKSIERNLRQWTRGVQSRIRQKSRTESEVPWHRGDLLVLSGSTWDMISPVGLKQIIDQHGVRLVTIVSDLIPILYPQQFADQTSVESFRSFLKVVARDGSLALSISHSTQQDLLRFAKLHRIKVRNAQVLHLGADVKVGVPVRPAGLSANLTAESFALAVGTIQVRKNHQLLYQIWRRFAEEAARTPNRKIPRLVIVGARGWLTGDLLAQLEHDPLTRDSITVLNSVNDDELSWLYRNCAFTLYPAIYEGWGLPIVESLSHGKPCIASSSSSMPEAGQGLAHHLDPMDFRAWYETIHHWFEESSARAIRSERIKSEYVHRSWDEFSVELTAHLHTLMECSDASKSDQSMKAA